jgi:hypothetical protein
MDVNPEIIEKLINATRAMQGCIHQLKKLGMNTWIFVKLGNFLALMLYSYTL